MYKCKFLQVGQLPWEHLSFLQNQLFLINFYHRVAFIAQFDDSSPAVTLDKEICHMIMS